MNNARIIVVPDAGAAGRVLLGRRDLDVCWAFTTEEAIAVVNAGLQPRVCLVREELAHEVLKAFRELPRAPSVVVLMEPEGLPHTQRYFAMGATALVAASSANRILEATAELTGVAFRGCPRVPLASVIDADIEGETLFLETLDLSKTGVSVRGMLDPKIGMRADLHFVLCEPPVTVKAMVVRTFEDGGERVAGMCFVDLTAEQKTAISTLVEREEARIEPLPDPTGLTADLGTFSIDLRDTIGAGNDADLVYANMLRELVKYGSVEAAVPTWLKRMLADLTPVEKLAARQEDGVPAWARAALMWRIHTKRMRLEADAGVTPADVARVADLCCKLAVEATGSPAELLSQATRIRTALLRDVYVPARQVERAPASCQTRAPARSAAHDPASSVAVGHSR